MRLTRQEMAEKYPDRYLGITNIHYENNDGVTIESAEVLYTDKTEEELLTLQISGAEDSMSVRFTPKPAKLLLKNGIRPSILHMFQ